MIIIADGKVVIDVILDDGSVAKGVANIDGRLGGLGSTGKKVAGRILELASAFGVVALASKAISMIQQSLDGAISRYDTLNNFPRVLQLMGFDAAESQKAINRLSDGIDGLPTTLDSVASTAQQIAVMTGDLDGAVETTLALNNAFLASGASTADAQRGLEQYVQMLSRGEVDLQSWRTLQETMPVALNKTAEAFGFAGRSAQNDLYDALKSGEITFDEFNGKLIELSDKTGGFADLARESSGGIKTSWQNMKTAIVKGVADVIGAIDEALGGTGSIAGVIDTMKTGIQTAFAWIVATIPVVAGWIMSVVDAIRSWLPPIDEMKNNFMTAFQTIYDFVMPIFTEIVTFIMTIWGGLVTWWQENNQMIIDAINNVMTFIMAIMQTIWPIVQMIVISTWEAIKGAIQGAIDVITGIINFFSALFTGNWSAMWDAVKQILSGAVQFLWNFIQISFVGKILKIAKGFVKAFSKSIKSMWDSVRLVFMYAVDFVKGIVSKGFGAVKSVVSSIMGAIRSVISSIWNAIKSVVSSVLNGIKSVVSSIWNGIKNTISTVVNGIKNTVSRIFNSLKSVVSGAFGKVKSAVKTGMSGAYKAVTGKIKDFFNAGKNIVGSIADGIKGAIGKVKDAIGSVTSKIRDFLPFSPAKEGALRDIMYPGITNSLAKNIKRGSGKPLKEMKRLTDDIAAEMQPNINNRLRGMSISAGNLSTNVATSNAVLSERSNANRYDDREAIIIKPSNVIMEGRAVGEITWEVVHENIERAERIVKNFRGR